MCGNGMAMIRSFFSVQLLDSMGGVESGEGVETCFACACVYVCVRVSFSLDIFFREEREENQQSGRKGSVPFVVIGPHLLYLFPTLSPLSSFH